MKEKVDIIQNTIDLAHALNFPEVRVALLSTMETINPDVPSTVEAGALCKMVDRGMITVGLVGPVVLAVTYTLADEWVEGDGTCA